MHEDQTPYVSYAVNLYIAGRVNLKKMAATDVNGVVFAEKTFSRFTIRIATEMIIGLKIWNSFVQTVTIVYTCPKVKRFACKARFERRGAPNGKATVLKTVGRNPLQVRVLSPPHNQSLSLCSGPVLYKI